jgi:hypothetical protein
VPLERGRAVLLVGVLLLAGCRQEGAAEAGPGQPAAPPRAFVVFSEPSLVIDRVGATEAVPAAVGSTLSPQTLSSDDPSVVEVTASGSLHALKAGRTTVRSLASPGQSLDVEVRTTRDLVLVPNPLTLPPRGEGELALFDRTGGGLEDPARVRWFSSSPDVASVIDGRVKAGAGTGAATITAEVAGRAIQARVTVTRTPGPTKRKP